MNIIIINVKGICLHLFVIWLLMFHTQDITLWSMHRQNIKRIWYDIIHDKNIELKKSLTYVCVCLPTNRILMFLNKRNFFVNSAFLLMKFYFYYFYVRFLTIKVTSIVGNFNTYYIFRALYQDSWIHDMNDYHQFNMSSVSTLNQLNAYCALCRATLLLQT